MIERCPKCKTALKVAPAIGPFCPNEACDVVDNIYGQYDMVSSGVPVLESVGIETAAAERARVVAYLTAQPTSACNRRIIRNIERGEHLKWP